MLSVFGDPFLHNALIAGLIMASVFSLLGLFVLLRQVVFIGIAMAQAASAGVAFSFFAASTSVATLLYIHQSLPVGFHSLVWAGVFTVLAVGSIFGLSRSSKLPANAAIGVVFCFLWSLAILFVANSAEGVAQVRNLIEGDLLMILERDILTVALSGGLVTVALVLFWRHHVLVAFDEDMAQALGYSKDLWSGFFFVLLGGAIVLSVPFAGLLAIFTWMVIPPSAGLVAGKSMWQAAVISLTIALGATIGGLEASLCYDLPVSPCITVLAVCLSGVVVGVRRAV